MIPFANAVGQLSENIGKALSHPVEFIGAGLKAYCTITCEAPFAKATSCTVCTIAEYVNMALDTLCDLGLSFSDRCNPFWDDIFQVDDSVCKEVLSESEE
jgi:hypothetical protein